MGRHDVSPSQPAFDRFSAPPILDAPGLGRRRIHGGPMLHLKLLISLVLIALAQFAELRHSQVAFNQAAPDITRVEALPRAGADENGAALDIRITVGSTCDAELQANVSRFPDNIDIALYRDLPPGAECRAEEDRIDLKLSLPEDRDRSYLIINSRVWQLSYPASGDAASSLSELDLIPLHIDEAAAARGADASQVQVELQGYQAVGCDLPEIFSLRRTSASVQLGAYNAIMRDRACPDALVPVDAVVALSATELPPDALFSVNGKQIPVREEQNVSDSDKVLTNILRVDVHVMEIYPMQLRLEVEGEHPDGCEYPVFVGQQRRDNTIDIEVYREVPADVICPMILKPYRDTIFVDGGFESGEYTLNVNSHSQVLKL